MESAAPVYESVESRAGTAVTFLQLTLALKGLDALYNLMQLMTKSAAERSDDAIGGLLAILGLVALIATAVFFCKWMRRAYENLPALGAPGLKYTPGWAIGYFFVPFANLIYPLRAMKEVWVYSEPGKDPSSLPADPHQATIGALSSWWGLFLTMNIIDNLSVRMTMNARSPELATSGEWIGVIGSLVGIPAALAAVKVIQTVTRFQADKARERGLSIA